MSGLIPHREFESPSLRQRLGIATSKDVRDVLRCSVALAREGGSDDYSAVDHLKGPGSGSAARRYANRASYAGNRRPICDATFCAKVGTVLLSRETTSSSDCRRQVAICSSFDTKTTGSILNSTLRYSEG